MILDTNTLSAAAESEPAALAIVATADRLDVPVVVLGEYRLGITRSRYKAAYEEWLAEWVRAVTVLDVDAETARSYAAIGVELRDKGTPIPTNDLWIAALCRQHSLPLLSRDHNFDYVSGLKRLEW